MMIMENDGTTSDSRTTQTWKSWKIMKPIMENHGATSETMVNRGTTKGNIESHETDHGESWNNFVEQTPIMEQLWKSWKIMEHILGKHEAT